MKQTNVISKNKMECTICYESDARCEFVCGHSFSYQCVKTWYQKGSHTCPMCRGDMCFRGVTHAKKVWDCEKREQVLEEVIEELFGEMDEADDYEYYVEMMSVVYERFNKVLEEFPAIDSEMLDFVLRVPWIDLNVSIERGFYEFPTYTRYIMVSKTAYGVHRKIKCVV